MRGVARGEECDECEEWVSSENFYANAVYALFYLL
jgi:hypothetical protein